MFQTLGVSYDRSQYISFNQRRIREQKKLLRTGAQSLTALRTSVNTTGGGSGLTAVEVIDPDNLHEELRHYSGVLPIRDHLSTVTTAGGVTVTAPNFHADQMEGNDSFDESLFSNYQSQDSIASASVIVNTRGPNMNAPATLVRPSHPISSQHGELWREVRTNTGEIVTLIGLTQRSGSSGEDEELPDPERSNFLMPPPSELQYQHVATQSQVAAPVVNNLGTEDHQQVDPLPNMAAGRPRIDPVQRPRAPISGRRRTTAPTAQEK